MEERKPLIVLTGPTAVGKTELSVKLARRIGGEILSADSMQVYRHMDIGSAKIRKEEMEGIPHHLIDILNPDEEFNVTVFQRLAKECLEGIFHRGHIPIMVGGTGFYIQALLYDVVFEPEEENTDIRKKLERLAAERGAAYLHRLLKEVDPDSAQAIHENNRKRVIRALEFYEQNQYPISLHNQEQRKRQSAYLSCYFVLNDDRQKLYERIDQRVDQMLEEGLLDEVEKLRAMGYHKGMVSMQGLGYKERLGYLDGELSLEEAVRLIKRDSRHFAKRQLTWFRRERDVIWINKQDFSYDRDQILSFMEKKIAEKCEGDREESL